MDDDEHFISKMLTYFSHASCNQEEITLDNIYSGPVLADFLSTFDLNFFTEEWHDEIIYSDRTVSQNRIECIKSIYNRLCDYYIAKLSRHLGISTKWKIDAEMIAIELNRHELSKLLIEIIFVAGTKPAFAEKLQIVFDEAELSKLVERLAIFNYDIPPICDDDRKVLLDLVQQNQKEKEKNEKRFEKMNRQISELTNDKEILEEELQQLQRDYTLLKDKSESMIAVIEQHNVAKRQFEDTYTSAYSIEQKIHNLEAENKELNFKNKELEKELREKSEHLEIIQEESTEIVNANRQLQDEITKLRKEKLRISEPKIETKEEELLKLRLENYIAEVSRLRSQVTEIEALKAHATNLQLINNDFEKQLSEMTERCHQTIAENSALRRKMDDIETNLRFSQASKRPLNILDDDTPTLQEELNGNIRSTTYYEDQLIELEKENATLKAKLDNIERQHYNLLTMKEETDEQRKTSNEVLQAKLSSYIVMYDDAESKLKKVEEDYISTLVKMNEQQIEIERLKGESAQMVKLLKEKEQALEDYVELHIQTNEALGSTTIGDESKLVLDYVDMKVKNEKLMHELRTMTEHRDALIQEQRLIASHWYQLMLERHGDSTASQIPVNNKFLSDDSNIPPRTPTLHSNSAGSNLESGGFFHTASKRFPKLFKQ